MDERQKAAIIERIKQRMALECLKRGGKPREDNATMAKLAERGLVALDPETKTWRVVDGKN